MEAKWLQETCAIPRRIHKFWKVSSRTKTYVGLLGSHPVCFPVNFVVHHANSKSETFSTWAPRLHEYQVDHLERLHKRHPKLRRNFQNGSWGAATFNFGPQTVCFDHRDHANLAFGWCSVTAMGKFDFKRCGHLILWDMGLVIQFPPGSTIMIPSATIRHSNVRLGKDGTRMSFTQFTAGGLFRWVDAGFRTSSKFLKQDRKGKAIFDEMLKDKWEMGLGLFSTLKELKRKKN